MYLYVDKSGVVGFGEEHREILPLLAIGTAMY